MTKSKADLLSRFIAESGLTPRFNSEKFKSSISSDIDYRYALISLSIAILGKEVEDSIEIDLSTLSFGHFLASRPYLLPRISDYLIGKKNGQIPFESYLGFPRGYLRDIAFKDSIYLLIRSGVMSFSDRDSRKLRVPKTAELLSNVKKLNDLKLLSDERNTLEILRTIRVPKSVIEIEL